MTARKIPICGIILAAGKSSRMGSENKLTRMWRGKPLVRHVVDAAMASRLDRFAVVTGHEAETVSAILPSDTPQFRNDAYETGMASSILAGTYRLQGHAATMILLGDMPLVSSDHINLLIDAFESKKSQSAIVAATCDGKLGNPVLFGLDWFAPLKVLEGDKGARTLIEENRHDLTTIEIGEAAKRDFDLPADFTA